MPTATNINNYECLLQAHFEVNQGFGFLFFFFFACFGVFLLLLFLSIIFK